MPRPSIESHQVTQILHWGPHHQERISDPETMYAQTGRRIYVLGDIDGRFRPRSNPYDLHTFGKSDPNDPLAEKLQGVWSQPVKGLSRYSYSIQINGNKWQLNAAETFTQSFAYVEFLYKQNPLQAIRRDYAALDFPVLFSTLTLVNEGRSPIVADLYFEVEFDLQDAWFTHLAQQRNTGQSVAIEHNRLIARAEICPNSWAVAVGSQPCPERLEVIAENSGQMCFTIKLEPGDQDTLVFAMAIESVGGAPAALAQLDSCLPSHHKYLSEKIALYDHLLSSGPHLKSPDLTLNSAFDLARANLQMLEAHTTLGRYFYAGLEIFPFWFSNDGAYSLPGILASGLTNTALSHTRIGFDHLGAGQVPHQISPSGQDAFAGNAQETPLWVLSVWDAYRWSGNREFLAAMFPGACKGMFDYVLNVIDTDGDGYPSGPGMVEVEGMGAEKLDSAAYTWAALHALENMADELGDPINAGLAREKATEIGLHFDRDWWNEPSGTYSMSLEDPGNAQSPLPHWAVIVPLEVGLATTDHAASTFITLRRDYLNRWGLKHTVGEDERVWTLPTATLSRAAYRYGENNLGETMLRCIVETLRYGPIGLFHELIPEGACIIQLWSAATFIRGIIEDMLGISVNASGNAVTITPRLPVKLQNIILENLSFGSHLITIQYDPGSITVTHSAGIKPLRVKAIFPSGQHRFDEVPVGKKVNIKGQSN